MIFDTKIDFSKVQKAEFMFSISGHVSVTSEICTFWAIKTLIQSKEPQDLRDLSEVIDDVVRIGSGEIARAENELDRVQNEVASEEKW